MVPVFNTVTMQKKYKLSEICSHLGPSKRKLVAFRWWGFVLEGQCGFWLPGHAAQAERWCLGLYCQERWAMGDANVMKLSEIQKSWLTISRILAQIDRKITSPMDFSLFFCAENFIFLSSFPVFFIPLHWKSHQISIGDVGHGRKASWVMATTFSSHGHAPHGACVLGFGPGQRMRCPWRRRQSWAVGSWLELCGFEKRYGCFQK